MKSNAAKRSPRGWRLARRLPPPRALSTTPTTRPVPQPGFYRYLDFIKRFTIRRVHAFRLSPFPDQCHRLCSSESFLTVHPITVPPPSRFDDSREMIKRKGSIARGSKAGVFYVWRG